jgi:DUF4097 and DUF4098 domain-containing protein YvlB
MKKFKLILKSLNSKEKFSPLFLLALSCLSFQIVAAQQTPKPTEKVVVAPTPDPKIIINPKINTRTLPPTPSRVPPKSYSQSKVIVNESGMPAEKSIAVESKVNVTLCVREGNVKINGWDRDEIRAFVQDGSQVGFIIVDKNQKSQKPVWVKVLGYEPQKNQELNSEECLSGSEIELDVPRNSTIKLKSMESELKIESVSKVSVETLNGDIYLNDIANGIEAKTYRGDLTVEKSSGQMILTNTDGNIIALGVSPSEIGDIFKATTNSGRITLQGVEHRQIGTSSISGSTIFDGDLLSGGQYSFATTNGSIGLLIPSSSLCKINAWFGYGAFGSEIPLQNTLKKEQSLSAQLGTDESNCSLNLKTGSGNIKIKVKKAASKEPEKSPKDVEKSSKSVSQNCPQKRSLPVRN